LMFSKLCHWWFSKMKKNILITGSFDFISCVVYF